MPLNKKKKNTSNAVIGSELWHEQVAAMIGGFATGSSEMMLSSAVKTGRANEPRTARTTRRLQRFSLIGFSTKDQVSRTWTSPQTARVSVHCARWCELLRPVVSSAVCRAPPPPLSRAFKGEYTLNINAVSFDRRSRGLTTSPLVTIIKGNMNVFAFSSQPNSQLN